MAVLVVLCVTFWPDICFRGESMTESSKYLLPAGSLFPKGLLCKELLNNYDWLNFDKIRERTNLWKDSTKPVVVAVLDTGIYERHDDLKGIILTEQSMCFLPDADSQKDLRKDRVGHGTMVAGIIGLYGPENVRIINLKVFDADGNGSTDALRKALEHVSGLKLTDADGREYGVDIINMSLGQFERFKELERILTSLADDKIMVAAVGNESAQMSNAVNHPAKHPNVIGVGAHGIDGLISSLSSRGPEVKFLCPGESVVSTRSLYKDGIIYLIRNYVLGCFGYVYYLANGTSFASPYAAAVAAHVLVAMEGVRGPDDRKEFCSSTVMLSVLQKLSDEPREQPGVLRAYEKGFEDINDLYGHCDKALKGR